MFPNFFVPAHATGVAPTYPVEDMLVNPSAATGDMTGWTTSAGTPEAKVGRARPGAADTWIFWGGNSLYSEMYQRIELADFPAIDTADVDAGILNINVNWWGGTYDQSTDDRVQLWVRFRNSGLTQISELTAGARTPTTATGPLLMKWDNYDETYNIPANTRYIDIVFGFDRNTGTNNDGSFDECIVTITSD